MPSFFLVIYTSLCKKRKSTNFLSLKAFSETKINMINRLTVAYIKKNNSLPQKISNSPNFCFWQ